ncbi:M42 family metallopeptidase [Pseudoflavonifractor sp.]|jgi:putative aminopeptidase FrvX|uniref:M42 family metallopeptidase n=1 Tax=Pseudoflavonifractor sp. TaxID=1980281 RepID=UPI003D91E517
MDISAYQSQLMKNAQELLCIDSPSGFTQAAAAFLSGFAARLGYETEMTNKGNVIVHIPGRESGKKVTLCAHVDTLGLMVRSITADGQLKITRVGGPILPTLDGEYCTIRTRDGRSYTGTILSLSPASHVYDDAATRPRDEDGLAVRIDEVVKSREDVEALGIRAGDYVCIDPKTVVTGSGFLKSRFIDDKGSAACLLTLMQVLSDKGLKPMYDTRLIFSVHEEVGHGGATIPRDLDELLIVDMGCVGLDLTCTEYQVSICAKDSGGPYDYGMTTRLMNLARDNGLDYAVDIYPHYSSDATVAWRAGADVRAALIGPGVHASHGMERTHWEGMKNTMALCLLYLEAE